MTQFHFGDKAPSLILVDYMLKLIADKKGSLKEVVANVKKYDEDPE